MPGDDLIDGLVGEVVRGTGAERTVAEGTRSITIAADAGTIFDFTLGFLLTPLPDASSNQGGSTRVVTRVRIAIEGRAGPALEQALLLSDGAMVRKQLLGLKKRAEAAHTA